MNPKNRDALPVTEISAIPRDYLTQKENEGQSRSGVSRKELKASKAREPAKSEVRKTQPRRRRTLEGQEKEIHRLYFKEGLTQLEIARRFRLKSAHVVHIVFKEQGWKPRVDRRGIRMRVFKNERERRQARKEHRKLTQQRIRELRKEIFGTKCEICGIDTKEKKRSLCIHRKDGIEHQKEALWRIKYLKNLDRDEWSALCVPCHRGTHWLMDRTNMDWEKIESRLGYRGPPNAEVGEPLRLKDYEKTTTDVKDFENRLGSNAKEIRKALFESSCHLCGEDGERMRIVIHRKDGRPHDNRLLASAKYLKNLNSDEWVSLCQKCHRYTHWAKDELNLTWEDLDALG